QPHGRRTRFGEDHLQISAAQVRRDDEEAQPARKEKKQFIENRENLLQRVEALEDGIGEKRRNGVEAGQRQKYQQKCEQQSAAPVIGKIRKEICFQQFAHESPQLPAAAPLFASVGLQLRSSRSPAKDAFAFREDTGELRICASQKLTPARRPSR